MAQGDLGPCSDTADSPVPSLEDPTDLPTRIFTHRLSAVLQETLSLAATTSALTWSTVPPPVKACHLLEDLGERLLRLESVISDLRNHCGLLWEVSAKQASERRASAHSLEGPPPSGRGPVEVLDRASDGSSF